MLKSKLVMYFAEINFSKTSRKTGETLSKPQSDSRFIVKLLTAVYFSYFLQSMDPTIHIFFSPVNYRKEIGYGSFDRYSPLPGG
jgi:hypothetical protein